MNISIRGVRNIGDLVKERIVFKVIANTEIGDYMVFSAQSLGKKGISNRLSQSYWFPDGDVEAGDLVVLYTKTGTDREKVNGNGSTTHFYYWGLEDTIWDEEESVPLLVNIEEWNYFNIPEE